VSAGPWQSSAVGAKELVASLTDIAIRAGAVTNQVNVSPTDKEARVTHTLRGAAGAALPSLAAKVWGGEIS
jgi:hypothetical protein